MCDPFTAAALIATVAGSGAQAAGAASTKKQNAANLQTQTDASAAEFNKRDSLAKDIFAENSQVSADTYNQMAKLSDQEFATRTGLSKDTFNKLTKIQQDQVARDYAAAQGNVNTTSAARTGRDTSVDAAIAARAAAQGAATDKYNADVAAANAKQDQFRGQGDTVASDIVAAFTPEAMAARQADAAAARDALVGSTAAPTPVAASGTAKGNIRDAFARYGAEGIDKAKAQSAKESGLSSFTDALTSGGRIINRGNERTAFIRDAAGRALAPLGATLDASSLQYNNAGDTAAGRINAAKALYGLKGQVADADLAAALGLSETQARGETKPVTDYAGALDNAYGAFFGNKQTSAATRGDTIVGANNTRLQGSNSASQNFENNLGQISAFRMNSNSSPWSTLGQFASAIAPTLLNIGQRSAFNKAATPAPAGST